MEFVESHGHLDDDAFAKDLPQVIEAARAAGVRRFINIGYEPESWARSLALAEQHPDVSYALGMHPNSADRWSNDVATELEHLLDATNPVAIGETGLDYYREWVDRSSQKAAFRDQLELARSFSLPVIVHMRGDVESELTEILQAFPTVRVVFHSFDGSAHLRDFALRRGDMFGIGGLMTRSGSADLRETLREIPLDSMLLETDAPYLTPRGVKERRNTPANIPIIAQALADLLAVPIERIAEQTTANAEEIFQLVASAPVGAAQ
ncbi:MAG: TatD family hydrolase [Thermomicrobiales bacterium]